MIRVAAVPTGVKLTVPEKVSKQERELLEQLRKVSR